jgi:predicted Rossmann fold flavoprotein
MLSCAIIGTGPAALTAATFLTRAGVKPVLFERRPAPGWKLLVAGSSGLNVTYDCAEEELASHFSTRRNEMGHCLQRFPRAEWLKLLADLGEEPYAGSSHRWFLRNKTAASLLANWTKQLEEAGAEFRYGEELTVLTSALNLTFASGKSEQAKTVLLALGGGSWEVDYPAWPELLKNLGLEGSHLEPSNAGYSFTAPEGFFEKAEGKPVKGLILSTARGKRQGELMITKYGFEGTPIYTVGCKGPAVIDLKPDMAEEKLAQKIASGRGSMLSRIENTAKLSPGALLLLKALAYPRDFETPVSAARAIKHLDLELLEPRPLSESISASGGLAWSNLGNDLEAKKISGLFAAGEMVDWDAPTGGFLIQGSVSMGFVAAEGILKWLKAASSAQ